MTTARVKKIQDIIVFTATWAAGVLTVVTNTVHDRLNADLVTLTFGDSPQELVDYAITYISTTSFSILTPYPVKSGYLVNSYFRSIGVKPFSLQSSAGSPALFQVVLEGTGALTSTVVFSVSLDNKNWIVLSTSTLSVTTSGTDGFSSVVRWPYMQANITALTGTAAKLTMLVA